MTASTNSEPKSRGETVALTHCRQRRPTGEWVATAMFNLIYTSQGVTAYLLRPSPVRASYCSHTYPVRWYS